MCRSCVLVPKELAERILPRPTSTPAGDKPPHYIFSFGLRPTTSTILPAGFAGGEPASRLIAGRTPPHPWTPAFAGVTSRESIFIAIAHAGRRRHTKV